MATVHVIGAGLAGLSAAVTLAGARRKVQLYEAAGHAGGRCRSYHDETLGMRIDNGNHILLSGNGSALAYLAEIGALDRVSGPDSACFAFVDLESEKAWTINLGSGRVPLWIFQKQKRVPETRARDYFALLPLSVWRGRETVAEAVRCAGPLYRYLLHPMLLAVLNNDPGTSSARLAASVLRETVARGGRFCRPLVAVDGLGAAFIDPALQYLGAHDVPVRFGWTLRSLDISGSVVRELNFGDMTVALQDGDAVILTVPPQAAGRLLPGLNPPDEFRSIANIHFRVEDPLPIPSMLGVINGAAQWIFQFPGRVSVTISNFGGHESREALAARVWREIMRITGCDMRLPPWQVILERRATFATVPAQEAKRPGMRTSLQNLFLAGDWTATGLPPTIEGAIRSGHRAAQNL
jgi:squalene-associated FAD-dependent desaturase